MVRREGALFHYVSWDLGYFHLAAPHSSLSLELLSTQGIKKVGGFDRPDLEFGHMTSGAFYRLELNLIIITNSTEF